MGGLTMTKKTYITPATEVFGAYQFDYEFCAVSLWTDESFARQATFDDDYDDLEPSNLWEFKSYNPFEDVLGE